MSLELIAQYYDLLYANFEDDLPMWAALTEPVEAPILEVGCGTGRILLPLAGWGHTMTGLDLSETALATTQAKLTAAGLTENVTLQQADMRYFKLPDQTFGLAFIPLNTFMHCHTIEDQLATLQAIHAHLQPGGQVVIDLFQPDPALLAEADGRLYFEDETSDPKTGHTVQWYWRHDIDLAAQMRHLVYVLDEIDEAGWLRRVQIPFSLRYFYRYELELLLKLAGFRLAEIYGDYSFEPFDSHSPRMIVVAERQ